MKAMKDAPFRLAFRVEGEFWNAYVAPNDTMTGAKLLGSIRMAAVQDETRKAQFQALMQDVLAVVVKDMTGLTIEFLEPPKPAPEHERAGSA